MGHKPTKRITEEFLQSSIGELNLGQKLHNVLENACVLTVQDLLYCCPKSIECQDCPEQPGCNKVRILGVVGFGVVSLEEVLQALERLGYIVKDEK